MRFAVAGTRVLVVVIDLLSHLSDSSSVVCKGDLAISAAHLSLVVSSPGQLKHELQHRNEHGNVAWPTLN